MSLVLVGMSGGVDSSVAAAVLVDAGHEVVGVTMRLWGGDADTGCCSVSDVDDARRVADQLGIDHVVFNFSDDFEKHVVTPYVDGHRAGITPNPCIECNRHLKFERLAERAHLLGFDAVATGHHAQIERRNDRWALRRGADPAKDQSYVLHMADQATLARTLLPIGAMHKDEVRAIAREIGLRTAGKPDSQDVCFIRSDEGRARFLGDRIPLRAAAVVDTDGVDIGRVESVETVTIGQRRGLGLPGGGPVRYVVDVDHADPDRPVVVVGAHDHLLRDAMTVGSMSWTDAPVSGDVLVQVSAHGEPMAATIDGPDASGRYTVTTARPHRRVAPGQSAVLYDLADDCVLGGGIVVD
ncbi:MAG: tRNA 2-thiouridine(34) synthase MnmA [Actinobacteria bacterium]|nr:tRNA 2-thiouridine(34) synthase MnmA [Actinomycetota bacterium]